MLAYLSRQQASIWGNSVPERTCPSTGAQAVPCSKGGSALAGLSSGGPK